MFRKCALAALALALAGSAGASRGEVHEFRLAGSLLREVARQGVVVELPVRFTASGGVHPVQNDCEMHWAAVSSIPLGDPDDLVAEPPNVCRSWPPSPRGGRRMTWRDFAERTLLGRDATVRGFPRIASEHADGGGSPATPAHIVEIHPLLGVRGPATLDFSADLRAVPGMVHKRPEVCEPTVSGRRLWMRRAGDSYVCRDNGEGADWNFAIADVAAAPRVRAVRGGHAFDARVRFRDDGPWLPLTLYTLAGTAADARAAQWPTSGGGVWRVLGLLTYDPLALVATAQDARGARRAMPQWSEVRRPLAFVVWGETSE